MSGNSLRILVVDDSRSALESEALLLSVLGHEVETAAGGEEALEAARHFEPDVILMDIGMPDLNGWDVASKIRAMQWQQRPILVALTAFDDEQSRDKSWRHGFDFHFTKPADLTRIAHMLAAKIRRTRAVVAS